MKPEDIDLLVMDLKRGDQSAFKALYTHFFVPMKRFAVSRVGEAAIADDLVQNVWLKIGKRVGRLHDVTLFRSWLYKALRWEIIDWQRTSTRLISTTDSDQDLVADTVNTDVLDVMPLLGALDSNERDVVELYYLNELSLNETALALGVPTGTVKSRLSRARNKLRAHYED